ncbi:unnamed protein product [Rotaria sordida]|uniref:MHD1 domain-containing protein n=3 Tax=Rotaria sordida TaxID=392033 RepID=A0A814JIY0_9BILA|nr:unnamed protein product [Rotaria sordida]
MEVEGGEKYRTEHAEAGKPVWESLAEFSTNQILPIIKIQLFMENPGLLSLDDNKLGKLSLQIDPTFNKTNWWIDMIKSKYTSNEQLKVKLDVRMEKPQNLKMCGWCYAREKNVWKTWKRRYYALVQISQYCFATCSYRERKSEPTEMMPLEGYTVDYAEPDNAVREGDVVTFATNEENERHNSEHYQEAFKQYNDLLIEHEEIFWSLFAVDMEHVIDQQPIESWDSFPLFQLLNDYLRQHDTLSNGRFHQQLRDTFAPLVIRYVDLMESCIAQSIHKGFEKENWKSKTRGCATSEDMLWKLDALQCFIRDLHWPDAIFAEHLEKRLKQMASDMIEACGKRVCRHFENWIKKGGLIGGTSSDYLLPSECCVMVNVILDCKAQALKLCALHSGDLHQYHTRIDEYLEKILSDMSKSLIQKLVSVLDSVFKKLSRYDEGSFFAQILSLTKPINEDGQSYVSCVNANLEQLRQRISDEIFTLNIFEEWYRQQTHFIFIWLGERAEISLHPYQLACLLLILKKTHGSFELQGVQDKDLNSQAYSSIMQRLHFEETANAVK